MKYINKLILGKNYIEYIFNTNLSKSELDFRNKDYWKNNLSKLKCFKLTQITRIPIYLNDYCYKIVIDYKVYNLIEFILNDTKSYLIGEPITLQISYNKCENLVKILSELDCFNCIVFCRGFSTSKYSCIKNMKGIKYVIYKGLWNNNLIDLPENIDIIKLTLPERTTKLLSIPSNTANILIEKKYNGGGGYALNLENSNQINKIFFVNDTNYITDLDDLEYDYLAYFAKNNSIDFTNLPSSIKIIELSRNFDNGLDYLPHGVEKIIINEKINSSLLNLPSSVKEINFNNISINDIDYLNLLPDFIEKINISFNSDVIKKKTDYLINISNKIKVLNIDPVHLYPKDILDKLINIKNGNTIKNKYKGMTLSRLQEKINKYY